MNFAARLFVLFCLAAALAGLNSCESEVAGAKAQGSFATGPNERPGLGTKWGEDRNSAVQVTAFVRSDRIHPIATAAVYYNDEKGIRAMAGNSWFSRGWAVLPGAANGLISFGLKGDGWGMLSGAMVNGKWFVAGESGHRYSIVVRNKTDERLEIVASVDGLDVLDGRAASPAKRGYLLRPHATQVIEGFRKSTEAVAAFRFGAVSESYAAQKYRHTENVGVIGVAIFSEAGSNLPSREGAGKAPAGRSISWPVRNARALTRTGFPDILYPLSGIAPACIISARRSCRNSSSKPMAVR